MHAPPPLPNSYDRRGLTAVGFEGWLTWPELRASAYEVVPCLPGAYVVVRPLKTEPVFVHPSPAYWMRGQDPRVADEVLLANWVFRTTVLYIGKADYRKRRQPVEALRRRLWEYGTFGAGDRATHWGGRYIWQLADAHGLLVAWHASTWGETGEEYEDRLLPHFQSRHGDRLPFANLRGARRKIE